MKATNDLITQLADGLSVCPETIVAAARCPADPRNAAGFPNVRTSLHGKLEAELDRLSRLIAHESDAGVQP